MNISILGSTGSIGTQTLDIVRKNGDMKIISLTADRNVSLMEKQIREFKPLVVCMADKSAAEDLRVRVSDTGVQVLGGADGLIEAAVCDDTDIVVTAVVGISGLKPTISAIKAGNINYQQELMEIAKIVDTDKNIRYCPHGRPVCFVITKRELEKQFGRV